MAAKTPQRLWIPEKEPLTALRGVNVTASEQTTLPSELSGGQNVFSDMFGATYCRPGSDLLGGVMDTVGCQGGWVFRDNEQRIQVLSVVRGIIYYFDGSNMTAIPSAPTLSASIPAQGCFFPDTDKFYITNGTDSVVEIDLSGGTPTATSKSGMQKSKYLGYLDHHLYFLNLPTGANQYALSDLGAITMNAASVGTAQGYILGMANLDNYNAIMVTDQMAYRMSGTDTELDASLDPYYVPNSFLPIGPSRAIAPRSIITCNNAVYWIGLDAFNTCEVYRTDGQQIVPVGWSKIKAYLRDVNTADLSNACAVQYGVYAKFAVPSSSSAYNDTEILLDTARSVSYTESGQYGPPQIVWEPKHVSGFNIAQYAVWRTEGQDFILAFDAVTGAVHRTGVGLADELSFINNFPVPGSSPTIGSITITSTTPISQPFTATSNKSLVTAALAVSAYATGGTVTFSVQADSSGSPSGTNLYTATVVVGTTPPPVIYSTFPSTAFSVGNSYHIVVSVSAGTLTARKQTPAVSTAYLQKSGSSWSAGTGSPLLMVTALSDIDASIIWTSALERPLDKKKPSRFLTNGISSTGANMELGVGTQGRDGAFTDTSFTLNGPGTVWGYSVGTQPANVLHWANADDPATSSNSWASANPDYEVTTLAPWYSVPSHYVSIRYRSVGQADWRINSVQPICAIIPTTVA